MDDSQSAEKREAGGSPLGGSASDAGRKPRRRVRRFGLIDLMKLPSAPCPFRSDDAGETWVWGDFFLTLQSNPPAFINATPSAAAAFPFPITYPYALSAFYHVQKNPHGPLRLPVAIATLERGVRGHLMLCMFLAGGHLNYGLYTGDTEVEMVRNRLFDLLQQNLGLSGQPRLIGSLKDAYGHPETGLGSQDIGEDMLRMFPE